MENWQTTKEDWTTEPVGGVIDTDFNRIEQNIGVLHGGNGQTSLSILTASAAFVLDIGTTEQSFVLNLDASYNIQFITTTGRQPGNQINLIISGTASVQMINGASSPPAGSAPVYIAGWPYSGLGDYTLHENQLLRLVYSGTAWHCNH